MSACDVARGKRKRTSGTSAWSRNGDDNGDDGDGVNDGSSCRDVKLEKERGEGREGKRKEERKRR